MTIAQISTGTLALTGTTENPAGSLVGPGAIQVVFRLDQLVATDIIEVRFFYTPPSTTGFYAWAKQIAFGTTTDAWWDGTFASGIATGYITPPFLCPAGATGAVTVNRISGTATINVEYEAFSL